MFTVLLDILIPERALQRDQETFRIGMARLLKPLPSDSDPINRQLPDPAPVKLKGH